MALISSYWSLDALFIFLLAFVAAYFYMIRNFGHWKGKGVLEIRPTPFLGNFGSCVLLRMGVFEYLRLLYEKCKDLPYMGFYICDKPALVLRDRDIIKTVLVKDFNSFCNRYIGASESDVLGYNNLFMMKNPLWKVLRTRLTPVFSSGKIKGMYSLVDGVGDELSVHLNNLDLEGDGQVIELRDICARYTTDCIASCAFGLQVNSLENPDAAFRAVGRKSFEFTYWRGFQWMLHFFVPRLAEILRLKFFTASSSNFFRKAFLDTMNERLKSGAKRNDLIDLLIVLRENPGETEESDAFVFDDDKLVAQAALFFAGGFETSSTVLSFTLHELSLQPDLQTKLRNEITAALEESGGKLSYETMHNLPYLDQVVSESLRKYPSIPFLDRVAGDDYTFEKTGLVIKKGTPVYVSLLGLHYDPEYYPDPEHYDPERFNAENKRQRPSFVYLPFGSGPRSCIGIRFGMMQIKIGIIKFLENYQLTPSEQTIRPMHFDAKGYLLRADGGLHHRVRRIQTNRN